MKKFQEYIDKVYVLHVKEGYEDRAKHIERELAKHDIIFSYMLDYDIPDLTKNDFEKYFVNKEVLTKPHFSISRKHYAINEDIVANNYNLCLVLEDDVFLDESFNKIMNIIIPDVYVMKEPVIVSLGNGANMYVSKKTYSPGKYLYEADQNRCADSFLINQLAARNRVDWFKNNRAYLNIDHMFNKIDKQMGNKILWLAPTIVEQGSQNGRMQSSASRNKKFHRVRWLWKDFGRRLKGV